ncbi:tetratricopeptide repeat protein [Agrilutibacter solisilvae]|uniref:Tetratricopeptide repeat protein n=1 Tax=Agrilutibacter solisilvae TaxID=2763317 RepID=A0A975ASC5_9GAMM|nr:hypothetical protein [Lysobacter solisilvae]QSX77830.1 hypothetical protein I8J32_014025 [Lysobacter solisilvae]
MQDDTARFQALHERAYDAFDAGQLCEARDLFTSLIERDPTSPHYHYMLALAHKYLRDWPACLEHNLRSLELRGAFDESSHWNAGIAATALGDWAQARAQWEACGIALPPGEGPVEDDFGIVGIRLNPWSHGETLFARRVDVVRAQVLNVPLPESGLRCGDVVLHDGACTGQRDYGEQVVPVFNMLELLARSPCATFTVFIECPSPDDMGSLLALPRPGVVAIEDWTESVRHLCLRCSHGFPHTHERSTDAWDALRSLGMAAASRGDVEDLLDAWKSGSPGRRVESVQAQEDEPTSPADGVVWWRGPEDDDDGSGDGSSDFEGSGRPVPGT